MDDLDGRVAKLLALTLITEFQKVAPHTAGLMDNYMVELLSRADVEQRDREAITEARRLLSGVAEGLKNHS